MIKRQYFKNKITVTHSLSLFVKLECMYFFFFKIRKFQITSEALRNIKGIVNVIVGIRETDDTNIFQIYKTFYYLKYIKNKGMEIAKRIVFYSVKGPSPMPHCSSQKNLCVLKTVFVLC